MNRSASIAYGLSSARRDDTALLAQTRSACAEVADSTSSGRIEWVAGCGRTIESLEAAAGDTLLSFGIRRADSDIDRLKQRVIEDFNNLILAPEDQMLATDINQGRAGIEHVLAITQRLRLLEDRSREECATVLEVKVGTLDVLLFRACKSFRAACEKQGLMVGAEL